jgi:hypothetical protein
MVSTAGVSAQLRDDTITPHRRSYKQRLSKTVLGNSITGTFKPGSMFYAIAPRDTLRSDYIEILISSYISFYI